MPHRSCNSTGDLPPAAVSPIPVRTLAPNVVTLLAICAGLTAIRMAFEDRYNWRSAAIVFAAILDGVDGRSRASSRDLAVRRRARQPVGLRQFRRRAGADPLFLGAARTEIGGWIAAMVFAICGGLRLARFNAMIDDPNRPAWAANFFVGMPAPAGAITVLLPIYSLFLGLPRFRCADLVALYTLAIAFLMVSRLPVFSGKTVGPGYRRKWCCRFSSPSCCSSRWLSATPGTSCRPAPCFTLSVCRPDGNPIATISAKRQRTRRAATGAAAPGPLTPFPSPRSPVSPEPERPARLN